MKIFKKLLKRKQNIFHKMLFQQSEKLYETYKTLNGYLKNKDKSLSEKIYFIEREADDLHRLLIDRLNKTLITPFDREDIYSLSRAIETIIDAAKESIEEIELFKIEPNDKLVLLSDMLMKSSLELYDALKNLNINMVLSEEHAVKVKKSESHVHHVYLESLSELYDNFNNDAGYMFKMREIYRHLNRSADKLEEAANIILDIIIKNE